MVCKECDREFESLDSLRRHRSQKHNINAEQTYIDYVLSGIVPECKCGCGEKLKYLGIDAGFREYKWGHAARVNNNWGHNPNAIKKSHETQRRMYENGELIIWNKGLTIEDERVRDNINKVMANPERGNNISKSLIDVPKTEEHKKALSETAIIRWANPVEREAQSHRRMEYIIKNGFTKDSKLEDTFVDILKINFNMVEHEHYHRQHYVRQIKALYDFKISGKKILIEVDGDFWHCNPDGKYPIPIYESQKSNIAQDIIKTQWCVENGYKLLRFWEMDINNNPMDVIKRLKEQLGL